MPKKRTIGDDLISKIAMYRGHGFSFRDIGKFLDIPPSTLHDWLEKGKTATRQTQHKKLYHAVGKAEAEVIYKCAETVFQAGTEWRTTKVVEKDRRDKNGETWIERTVTKECPSWRAALAILERFTELWRPKIHILCPDCQRSRRKKNDTRAVDETDRLLQSIEEALRLEDELEDENNTQRRKKTAQNAR